MSTLVTLKTGEKENFQAPEMHRMVWTGNTGWFCYAIASLILLTIVRSADFCWPLLSSPNVASGSIGSKIE